MGAGIHGSSDWVGGGATVASPISVAGRKRLSRDKDIDRPNVCIPTENAEIVSPILHCKLSRADQSVVLNRALVNEAIPVKDDTENIILNAHFGVSSRELVRPVWQR
jgi:hypothetical protein